MKRFVLILVALLIVVSGGWFFYARLYPGATSSDSTALLLINSENKTYTFTTAPGQPTPPGYHVVGSTGEFNDQKITSLTAGLTYVPIPVSVPPQAGQVATPSASEQGPWLAAVSTLTPQQQQFCAGLSQADTSQYCIVRHLVLNALLNKKDQSVCQAIFVDSYRQECVSNITKQDFDSVPDKNHNGIIDFFESSPTAPTP